MSSRIPSATNLPLIFSGKFRDAKDEVKKIRKTLATINPEYTDNIFVLRPSLVDSKDKYRIFYNTPRALQTTAEEKEATATYLKDIMSAAYPQNSLETEMLQSGFQRYLDEQKNELSIGECLNHLKELHLAHLDDEVAQLAKQPGALPFAAEEPEIIQGIHNREELFDHLLDFLKTKKVDLLINESLGEGTYGKVVGASIENNPHQYAFKWEKGSLPLTGNHPQFWREGDAAASRLHSVGSRARTLFFILSVQNPNTKEEFHFVPTAHVKSFGMQLPQESYVFLHGQLMERAPGENINRLLAQDSNLSSPSSPHFNNIVRGLFKIIKEMQVPNLVHRDIKLDNLLYDSAPGKVTIIDFGLAERMRKQDKKNDTAHVNSLTSETVFDAVHYMSPRLSKEGETHGAEVDFFNYATVILNLISPKEFSSFLSVKTYNYTSKQAAPHILSGIRPEIYLTHYLKIVGTRGTTASILKQYPEIKEIINLAFQASAGGIAGAAALQKLYALPYFKV